MLIYIKFGEATEGEEFAISRVPCIGEMINTSYGRRTVVQVVHMRCDAELNEPQAIVFVGD